MKKCPECGAKNNSYSLICGECGASFEELDKHAVQVATAESDEVKTYKPKVGGPESDEVVAPYRPAVGGPDSVGDPVMTGGPLVGNDSNNKIQSVVGQPLNSQAANGGPKTDPYGTVTAPPRIRYQEKPDLPPLKYSMLKASIGSILMLIILAAAGWYSYQNYIVKPRPVLTVVRSFVEATAMNDWQNTFNNIDQDSQAVLQRVQKNMRYSRMPITLDFFGTAGQEFTEGKQYKLKVLSLTETTAKVRISPGPAPVYGFKEGELPAKYKNGFEISLSNINGEWKVNFNQLVADFMNCGYPFSGAAQYFTGKRY